MCDAFSPGCGLRPKTQSRRFQISPLPVWTGPSVELDSFVSASVSPYRLNCPQTATETQVDTEKSK